MPVNVTKLRTALDEQQGEQARGAAILAPAVAPDAMARAVQHSKSTGVPPLVVADNLPDFDRQAELDAIDAAARANPALAHLFRQPENVALAKGDLLALTGYGRDAAPMVLGPLHSMEAVPQGRRLTDLLDGRTIRQYASDFGASFRMAGRSMGAGLLQTPVSAANLLAQNPIVSAINLALRATGSDRRMPQVGAQIDPLQSLRAANATLDQDDMLRLSGRRKLDTSYADEAIAAAGERGLLAEAGQTVAERLRNPGMLVDDAGMLAGSMVGAPGMGPAMLGRANAAAQIGLGAAGQAGAVAGDVTDALVEKGVDPAAARAEAAQAWAVAMGIGLVLPRAVPGGDALERLIAGQAGRAGGSAALRVATPFLGETVTEGVEEGAIQALTNYYSRDPVGQGVGSAAALGFMGGAMMGVAPAAAEAAQRSFQAAAERDYVDRAVGQAAESALRQSAPDRFEAYAESVHPGAMVFVPQDALAALYQGEDNARAAMLDLTGDASAWDEAAATGGEVAIPLSKYVTHLAEQHDALRDKVRLQPGEALDEPVLPDRETILADIQKAMEEVETETARGTGPEGEVYDAFYGMLLPHYGDVGASQVAALNQSFYRTMAERMGTDALSLYNRFRINIAPKEGDSRGRSRDVDIAIDPLIDAALAGREFSDGEIYGRGLIDAIIRSGGIRPDSVGAGDLRASGARRPGFFNAEGRTVEAMAELLADDGWRGAFTQLDEFGRPDYRELLDLVRQELMGSPVYATDHDTSTQISIDKREAFNRDRAAVAGAFREYERRTGIDPATLTRKEQRAIAEGAFEDAISEPEALYQSAQGEAPLTTQQIDQDKQAVTDRFGEYEIDISLIEEMAEEGDPLAGPAALREYVGGDYSQLTVGRDANPAAVAALRDYVGRMPTTPFPRLFRVLGFQVDEDRQAFLEKIRAKRNGGQIETDQPVMSWTKSDPTGKNGMQHIGRDLAFSWGDQHVVLELTGPNGGPVDVGRDVSPVYFKGGTFTDFNPKRAGADVLTLSGVRYRYLGERVVGGDVHVQLEVVPDPQGPAALFQSDAAPTMRQAILGGLPIFQREQGDKKGPRGQVVGLDGKSIIQQAPDDSGAREFNITLFEGKDLSTILHESAHAFLEIFGDLAGDADAPAGLKADYAATLKWLGVTDRAQIGRDQHEQFARGFEAYAREGKAPSRSLRRAFAQFKTFLMRIYEVVSRLNVTLTDDVREVFDRLLASEAEIAEAQQKQGLTPLLTDFEGWTPAEVEAYQRAVADAQADAEGRLAAELLRAEQRAELAWWREERRRVRAQVEADTRALPVYRTLRWLRNGKMPDGSDVPRALKLSKAALLDDYGQSYLKHLRQTYVVDGGVRPDEAAALLGWASGREMIEALVAAPPLQEVIAADTDRIMAERYPDPMTDGTLADRAMSAVHSEKQADLLLMEISALERRAGRAPTQRAVMQEAVRRILAGKVARRIMPASYRAAEAKAGREALEAAAKGDMAAALDARRRQLLNHLLFSEATRIRAEVEKAHKYLAKFTKKKARAKLGKIPGDYLEQIDGLLERFDFRVISNKAADRRARLADWIRAKDAEGVTVDLPAELVDEAFSTPFRDLTVEQVRQLRDGVRHVHHLATLKGKLLLKGQVRDRAEIDAEVAASVRENSVALEDVPGEPGRGAGWARHWGWARATLGAATDMARRLDGYKDLGPVWRHTVGVIRDAINNEVNPRLQKAAKDVADLYLAHYTKSEIRGFATARRVEGVRGLWTKDRILSLALNWGNEGNREAILTQARNRLSPEEVGLLLGTLTERDWMFVQGVWDGIDAYWPEIAESQRRRKGLAPEKVQASSFGMVTADGKSIVVRGGYYPLKYEGGNRSMREEADEFYDSIRTGRFAKASTKDGHTIERVGSGGRSVRLDLGVVDSHLRDVIRDLHLGDAVNYVYTVLRGSGLSDAVEETGHVEIIRGMDIWLRDVATGEIGVRDFGQKAARFVRQNFTAAALTYKFVSAALQVTGLLQSSVVLGKGAMAGGLRRYARRPVAMTRYVTGASPFMASRVQSHVEAVQQVLDARDGPIRQAHSAMIRHGYWMIGRVQQVVDVATWLAAEAKGLEDFGGDVDRARAYADDVVSRAQGSGEFMDKTALQRGTFGDNVRQSEWVRASTMLQGYMITKHNAIIERTAKAYRSMDGLSGKSVWEGIKWAGDMANLLVVEAILVALIRGQTPDDEDEDGISDDWLSFMAVEAAGSFAGGIPGLGGLVSELRGYDSKGVVATALGDAARAIEQTKQKELDKALVKSYVRVVGEATGIPSGQINKTIDAIAAEQEGRDVSVLDYLRGPPKN